MLVNALHRSLRDRRPQVVTVFGRAGLGKSRLVRELYRHVDQLVDEPLTWRIGRCPPFGENVTFAALADIVKSEAGILDTDPASSAAQRLASAVGELVGPGERQRLVDALRPLVGLPGTALPAEETGSAWRRFLLALAARRPTVLVFEDLHWADDAMLRFVELLGTAARDVPLLLLCTARPELVDRDPSWAGTITGSVTITLPPLRDTGIAALYAHMFGRAAFSADMLSPLIEVAGGNPLYAHEYVRMLIEQGALRQSVRGWSLEKHLDLPMPESVHAVIANRIDLLDAKERTVLLAAAVVGVQFWPGAVAAALGQPVESVERALRRLEQRDFVHEQAASTMAGQPEYRFRHVLVRDVCYQRLPRTERVARHERTAQWLDMLSQSRDTDLAEVLAHHRWAAHEIARSLGMEMARFAGPARAALHRAARRAYALHSLDVAASHAGRALGLADDSDPLDRLQLELLSTEISFYRDGNVFLSGGGPEQVQALADRLLAHDDDACAARAWTLLGQAAWLRADRAAALACLDRAVELFDPLPDSPQKADAYAELGRLHMLNYERDPAVAAADRAAEIGERLRLTETRTNARITSAIARYQAGDRSGLDDLHAIVELSRANQLIALPRAMQNLAYAVCEEGDWLRSDALLSSSPTRKASGQTLTTSYSAEAMRAWFEGDFDRLLAAAEAFVDTPTGSWDMQVRGLRSCLLVLRGERVPQARSHSDDDAAATFSDDVAAALDAARRSGFHRPHWTMLGMGALCRALQGRRQEATALIDELADSWSVVPAIASGEWIPAAGYAASLAGREAAARVRAMLDRVGHRTPWSEAARRTVAGALAAADGDHRRAAELHLAGAEIYAGIPDVTDRMLALTFATVELERAGESTAGRPELAELRAFALRNHAPSCWTWPAPRRPPPTPPWPADRATRAGGPSGGDRLAGDRAGGRALGLLGVHVDVLAAGELHQLVHDLVGHRALDVPVTGHPGVAREVQRRAEPDPHPGDLGDQLAGRLDLVGVEHRRRDDQGAALQGQPGHAGLAPVEPAVRRAGALGIDAGDATGAQYPQLGVQGRPGRPAARAVDRDGAGADEEHLRQPALDALAGEVLGLGDERHPPLHDQRREDRVGERQVVAGEDHRPGVGHVVQPLDLRAEDQPQQRAEEHVLHQPVQHRRPFQRWSRGRRVATGRRGHEPTNPMRAATT